MVPGALPGTIRNGSASMSFGDFSSVTGVDGLHLPAAARGSRYVKPGCWLSTPSQSGRSDEELCGAVEGDRHHIPVFVVDDRISDRAANGLERGVRFTNPFFHPFR